MNKEEQEILEEFRAQSKTEGSIPHMIYALMQTSNPAFIDLIEKKAVEFISTGKKIGEEINRAENDPEKKAQWLAALSAASTSKKTPFEDDAD
jgi:hypothetical protein